MAKPGDTVRFLNSTGGGVITKIEGQLAFVDDGGFETPVLLKEIVVVLPAGHQADGKGAKKMFDQKAFDTGRVTPAPDPEPIREAPEPEVPEKVEETSHGDRPTLVLAFEPTDVRKLDNSQFSAVLVNDSNYWIDFTFLRRAEGEHGWTLEFRGTALPNELMDLAVLTHDTLGRFERIALQCFAYKKDREFTLQAPLSVSRRLDLTKFHKFHCFREGKYFDTPVMEIPLVTDGFAPKPLEVNVSDTTAKDINDKTAEKLSSKFRIGTRSNAKNAENPRKVLPLIEVDLHIGELLDTTAGMEPKDILGVQLDTVRKVMKENRARIGQKLVFIHGKGDGVLRKEVISFLKKEYPKADLQDASFREYGFGATLVTVH